MESILAEVTFLSPAEGGRRTLPGPPWLRPGHSGYIPHLVIEGPRGAESDDLPVRFREGADPSYGRPATFQLELMYPEVNYSLVVPGARFSLREGRQVVATGRVLDRWPGRVAIESFADLTQSLKDWRSFRDPLVYDAVGMMALFDACLESMRRYFTEGDIDQFAATIAPIDREFLRNLIVRTDELKDIGE